MRNGWSIGSVLSSKSFSFSICRSHTHGQLVLSFIGSPLLHSLLCKQHWQSVRSSSEGSILTSSLTTRRCMRRGQILIIRIKLKECWMQKTRGLSNTQAILMSLRTWKKRSRSSIHFRECKNWEIKLTSDQAYSSSSSSTESFLFVAFMILKACCLMLFEVSYFMETSFCCCPVLCLFKLKLFFNSSSAELSPSEPELAYSESELSLFLFAPIGAFCFCFFAVIFVKLPTTLFSPLFLYSELMVRSLATLVVIAYFAALFVAWTLVLIAFIDLKVRLFTYVSLCMDWLRPCYPPRTSWRPPIRSESQKQRN